MKKQLLLTVAFLSISHSVQSIQEQETEKIVVTQKQHILDLCKAEKKDELACKAIHSAFQHMAQSEWDKLSWREKARNLLKYPLPMIVARTVFSNAAYQLGTQLNWDNERIETEWKILCDEFAKQKQDTQDNKSIE